MKFQHESGRFFSLIDGQLLAEITYQSLENDQVLAIDHTFVDPSLRGQGVAQQLVEAVIEEARCKGQKIRPVCSYAISFFRRFASQYQDLLERQQ